jgi:hypothetical protein
MFLVYLDDSRDEKLCVFSGLIVPASEWRPCLDHLRDFRRALKASDGIRVQKELHAWKFVSGRGRPSDRIVTKYRRSEIFKEALSLAATMRVRLINGVSTANDDERLFEWIANRIERTMQAWEEKTGRPQRAILICDEGKEATYTRLIRRMGVYNPIPSRFGSWPEGTTTRNITVARILEDPFFKESQRSYLIQLVDFSAYALLRRENPVLSKSKYGLDTAFELLHPILLKEANPRDPEGVLRPLPKPSS